MFHFHVIFMWNIKPRVVESGIAASVIKQLEFEVIDFGWKARATSAMCAQAHTGVGISRLDWMVSEKEKLNKKKQHVRHSMNVNSHFSLSPSSQIDLQSMRDYLEQSSCRWNWFQWHKIMRALVFVSAWFLYRKRLTRARGICCSFAETSDSRMCCGIAAENTIRIV